MSPLIGRVPDRPRPASPPGSRPAQPQPGRARQAEFVICDKPIETAVWRLKALFGDRLRGRRFATQATEVFLRGAALNRMLALGMPDSVPAATA